MLSQDFYLKVYSNTAKRKIETRPESHRFGKVPVIEGFRHCNRFLKRILGLWLELEINERMQIGTHDLIDKNNSCKTHCCNCPDRHRCKSGAIHFLE